MDYPIHPKSYSLQMELERLMKNSSGKEHHAVKKYLVTLSPIIMEVENGCI